MALPATPYSSDKKWASAILSGLCWQKLQQNNSSVDMELTNIQLSQDPDFFELHLKARVYSEGESIRLSRYLTKRVVVIFYPECTGGSGWLFAAASISHVIDLLAIDCHMTDGAWSHYKEAEKYPRFVYRNGRLELQKEAE